MNRYPTGVVGHQFASANINHKFPVMNSKHLWHLGSFFYLTATLWKTLRTPSPLPPRGLYPSLKKSLA